MGQHRQTSARLRPSNKDTLRTGTVEPLIGRMEDAGVEADTSLFTSFDAK